MNVSRRRPRCCWVGPPTALGLAVALGLAGCADGKRDGVKRLTARTTPFLVGVAVPNGFELFKKMTDAYDSGGVRFARHEYRGSADVYAVRDFYHEEMPLLGWSRTTDQDIEGRVTIRFEKENEQCTVEIERKGLFAKTAIRVVVQPFRRNPLQPPRRPIP